MPVFVVPAPSDIGTAFVTDFDTLSSALWTTSRIVVIAFALSVVSGVLLAVLFSQSRII